MQFRGRTRCGLMAENVVYCMTIIFCSFVCDFDTMMRQKKEVKNVTNDFVDILVALIMVFKRRLLHKILALFLTSPITTTTLCIFMPFSQ
jgi:hypothetical protein